MEWKSQNSNHQMAFIDVFDRAARQFDLLCKNNAELEKEHLSFSAFPKVSFRIPNDKCFLHHKFAKNAQFLQVYRCVKHFYKKEDMS